MNKLNSPKKSKTQNRESWFFIMIVKPKQVYFLNAPKTLKKFN